MAGITQTYDPKAIVFTFLGVPLSGFADGSFVKVERNDDSFKLIVGADGESTRTRTRNRSGRVTLTLRAESPSNDFLGAAHRADELGALGGRGPASVKDLSGTSLHAALDAWIVKPPSSEYAKESGSREWIFETGELDTRPGGNTI